MSRRRIVVSWVLQVVAAAILAQTLFFKFTGAEESRFIFGRLGAEPWGRYAAGASELVAVALLLHPRAAPYGAVMAMGLMSGAIACHLAKLGIQVQGDGGLLFGLAWMVLLAGAGVAFLRRGDLLTAAARLVGTTRIGTGRAAGSR